jgi:putative ABC transport system permease protein
MTPVEPPRRPIRLLDRWLAPDRRESVVGDLIEEWNERRRSGRRLADLRLWLNALELGWRLRTPSMERKGDGMIETLWSDVRHGARQLAKAPAFTLVAVLTLALGIGANTAIFSVVNALLIRPLPLPDSNRLVGISGLNKQGERQYVSFPDFQDMQNARSLAGVAAFVPQSVNLTGRDEPTRVRGGFVSDNFFELLGVEPAQGRGFLPGKDDAAGAERVCVLQHETWRRTFGADPQILGKVILLNNDPFTVVGILPAGFRFPFDEVEVWMPHHEWPVFRNQAAQGRVTRANGLVAPLARLRQGVSLAQAESELRVLMSGLSRQFPEAGERSASVRPLREDIVADARLPLLMLLAAVALVLLIACANVANLMLSRAAARRREWAMRVALGARRGRLVSQLLTETGLLWACGCALGLLAGYWGTGALVAASPQGLPGGLVARLDASVIAYSLGLTAFTAVLFGLVPALRFSRPDVIETLKEGGRGGGSVRTRLRAALVVSQVALALVLLVGAGLLLRSLRAVTKVAPGFAAQNLLTMEYRLPANKYPQGPQQWEFHRQVVERVRALPGVRSATVIRNLPFSGNGSMATFDLPEKPVPADKQPRARVNSVDAYTFETMGIPLLRGRVFDGRDTADAAPVLVVSKRMAEQQWPGQDPIGKKVRVAATPPVVAEVIGVVGDIKQFQLDERDLPYIYAPQSQSPNIFNTLVARTEGDPMAMAASVRGALWSVDREQPVWKIRTVESLIDGSTGFQRFLSSLLSLYSVFALLLAAVGIYGVVAYDVTQRTHEIGVRMALGAESGHVVSLVLRHGMKITLLGVAVGLAGATAVTRLIRTLLFSVSPTDPVTLAGVSLLLAAVAFAATYLPARRATRVDPMIALWHG